MSDLLTGVCHCGRARWTYKATPGNATSCNCTACRRHGALWIYDFIDEAIELRGETTSYVRSDKTRPVLEWLFCAHCACVVAWRSLTAGDDGKVRAAVNVRLAPPERVGNLLIDHFDGLESFEDLPSDGTRVKDIWF